MKIHQSIIIICSILLFMNGYHSIDLYYNYHNLAISDITLGGKIVSIDDVYSNGIKQIIISLFLLILIILELEHLYTRECKRNRNIY